MYMPEVEVVNVKASELPLGSELGKDQTVSLRETCVDPAYVRWYSQRDSTLLTETFLPEINYFILRSFTAVF